MTSRMEPRFEFLTRRRYRIRLMIAIPVITTLLVLGLGWIIVDMYSRELMFKSPSISSAAYKARIDMTLEHTTIVIVIASGVAVVSGLAIAYAITVPIRRLTQDTASIAGGDLARTIHIGGEGEIAQLGSAFNDMVSSINKYLLQTMSGGVVTINDKGEITAMSADAEVILGVGFKSIIGHPITDLIPDIRENRGFHALIGDMLLNKKTFVGKEMIITTEERDSIPVSISASFLRDRDDTLVGLIISFEDVEHLRKLQEQMRIVDRLTTLGGLAAGIAHQVRNPLCSIRGLAQLMKENADGDQIQRDYSDVILSDVDRIDRVVDRLLKFIQPSATGWAIASINDIIDDTLILAKHEIRKKDIDLKIDYSPNVPKILCQRENMIQAILNIFVNAFQAIDHKGTVAVSTEVLGNAEDSESMIKVCISDSGPGIDEAALRRIFEPGFTTKEDGGGFGLAITKQTTEVHGGKITVESAPDKGATFVLLLPVRGKDFPEEEPVGNTSSA